MSRTMALLLVCLGGVLLEVVGILGLAALGVGGVVLSLGAIIPAVVTANGVSWVVMHYDEPGRSPR